MGRGYARGGAIYPEAVERGRPGRKRTAGALAAAATASWVALGSGPASAALVAERHPHTLVAPGGALVTCDVITTQSWLDGEARVSTELTGPEGCVASVVTVRWRYTHEGGETV